MAGKVNLAGQLASLGEHWKPGIVGVLNDDQVIVVKLQGDFVRHKHDETDDLFLRAAMGRASRRTPVRDAGILP